MTSQETIKYILDQYAFIGDLESVQLELEKLVLVAQREGMMEMQKILNNE